MGVIMSLAMNENKSRPGIYRRDFLKLLAAGGIAAAGGHILLELTPWQDYEQSANQIHKPLERLSSVPVEMLELVRYATLAANGHNTQPWKFVIKGKDIEIHPDHTRRLPVADSIDRELWISLGCSLENLLIAARAFGYTPEVTYPDRADFIHIRITADRPQSSPLFDAIPLRQNTRSEYDGSPIKKEEIEQIHGMPMDPGVVMRFIQNPRDMEMVLEYVDQGNLSLYSDKGFIDELIGWIRFNKKDALASLDGLYSRCSGNPDVPQWLGKTLITLQTPQQQADGDAKKLRTSGGAVVIASESDSKTAWVHTGQVYERLALKMTSLNIKSAFLNQPIEVPGLRMQFQTALGISQSLPQLLMRFGYASAMPRSLRRPLEQVLVQS